jgi:sugar/nucleoside kinase (ribokinase family)
MVDFTVAGHTTIDKIITLSSKRCQLGGPPIYSSKIAQILGKELNIITKVGDDIDRFLSVALENGIDLQPFVTIDSSTTRFVLDYRYSERRLSIESVCDDILIENIDDHSDAVLFAPIIGEISPEIIVSVEAEVKAIDPQGFVREIIDDGTIQLKKWFTRDTLKVIDVFKSSANELTYITGFNSCWRGLEKISQIGPEIVIATNGENGSCLQTKKNQYQIPAYRTKVLDPTGAGDAYNCALFSQYLDGEDPVWCASLSSAAASCVIETIGVDIRAQRKEIEKRAEIIFNKVEKR